MKNQNKSIYNSNLFIDKITAEIVRRINEESVESALEYALIMIEIKKKAIKKWTNTYTTTDKIGIKKAALTRIKNDTEIITNLNEKFISRFKKETEEDKMVR